MGNNCAPPVAVLFCDEKDPMLSHADNNQAGTLQMHILCN